MARVPQITSKDQVAPDKQHIVDEIAGSRGRVSGPFSVLLHSPEIAGRVAHLGAYIRFDSTLSGAERELAICTAARECDCQYVWSDHAPLALKEGVRQEALNVVASRGTLDSLTPDEALIVRFSRELFRDHRISEATFQAAQTHFGTQGVTELTATMGYYSLLACTLNAFEVIPEPGTLRLP
jgi:4-carboxymuconolactone decarboxylase